MEIKKINNRQQTFSGNVTISFNANTEELPKLINLLADQTANLSISSSLVIATFTQTELAAVIKSWPEVFGAENGTLQQIQAASRIHFKGRGFDFDITTKPIIYSILNFTPDSFYDGGRNASVDGVLKRIETELAAGTAIFEVSGKSSKPNFDDISAEEEWGRIEPFLDAIHKRFPNIVLAIDSNTNTVIEEALKNGIQIINDIDGFNSQAKLNLVAKYKPAVVTMFNGRNFNEQTETLSKTMMDFFTHTISDLTGVGLEKENIVIDPGVGFSNHNTLAFDLIKMKLTKLMAEFQTPIMIAISRKSFAKRLFNLDSADDRLIPTLLFEAFMTVLGGRVIRVHDAKETRQLIDTFELLKDQLLLK